MFAISQTPPNSITPAQQQEIDGQNAEKEAAIATNKKLKERADLKKNIVWCIRWKYPFINSCWRVCHHFS